MVTLPIDLSDTNFATRNVYALGPLHTRPPRRSIAVNCFLYMECWPVSYTHLDVYKRQGLQRVVK